MGGGNQKCQTKTIMQIASVHSGLFEVETKYIDLIDGIILQSRATLYKGPPDLVLHFL